MAFVWKLMLGKIEKVLLFSNISQLFDDELFFAPARPSLLTVLPGCCSQTFSSTRHLFLSPFSCCCPMGLELRDRTAAERDLMGISKSLENPQKLPFWSRVVVLGLFWPFLPPKKKRVGIESAAAAVGVLEWSWAASSFDRFSKAISSIGKRSSYTNALSLCGF